MPRVMPCATIWFWRKRRKSKRRRNLGIEARSWTEQFNDNRLSLLTVATTLLYLMLEVKEVARHNSNCLSAFVQELLNRTKIQLSPRRERAERNNSAVSLELKNWNLPGGRDPRTAAQQFMLDP